MARLPLVVREAGTRLLGRVPVRIKDGPNEGLRWSLASAGRGYRTGRFDADRVRAIARLLEPGDVVWDVGAHKGYVTLAAARRVGPTGRVVAVEPSRRNRRLLGRHLRWNDAENVRVVAAALGARRGEVAFGGKGSSLAYSVGRGDETVPLRTLDSLVEEEGLPPPTVLKIDVEGSEADVLRGASEHLPDDALVWISVHGRGLRDACREHLVRRGFRLFESAEMAELVEHPERPWRGDREMLAGGPGRDLGGSEISELALFRR